MLNKNERDAIFNLMKFSNNIEQTEYECAKIFFLEVFIGNLNTEYILKSLETSFSEQNSEDLELIIFIGFNFDLFSEEAVFILNKLIEVDWHYQHENIALILQKLKSPKSIDSLYNAALAKYEYLEYSDAEPLAVKCIWALGNINTKESYDKLKILAKSENEIIKKNAENQLKI